MPRPMNQARAAALKAGKRHYQGKPCERGHTVRHVVNRACVTCQREALKRRRNGAAATDDLDSLLSEERN